MKYAAQFLAVACLVILPASARSGGGAHGGGGGGFHGAVGGGFHGAVGGFHGGSGGGIGRGGGPGIRGNGYRPGFGRNRYGFSLRYAPGFYGGYPYYGFWGNGLGDWGYSNYDSGYYDPGYANQSDDYGYQQPPVVIYQTPPAPPVRSEIREYPDAQPSSTIRPAGEPPIYLIAIKGQDNILAGITYWVEGDTLQYINLQHVQKHVALNSVDRALTARLNHERNMDLRLPPA